jgi:hypothetical protein
LCLFHGSQSSFFFSLLNIVSPLLLWLFSFTESDKASIEDGRILPSFLIF